MNKESATDPRAPLERALRIVLVALLTGFGVAALLNLAFGRIPTGMAAGAGAAICLGALRGLRPETVSRTANAAFFGMVFVLLALVIAGHGTRDYGLFAVGCILFAASIFLGPRAYWGLAGLLTIAALLLGIAESAGTYVPRPVPPTGAREILNLGLIVLASAFGGRGIMVAIESALARERALAGELRSSNERVETIFRSSQSAIVVTRLEDGTYLEVNDACLELFGYEREEVVGATAVGLQVWEDTKERDRFTRLMRDHGGVRDFETRMRKRSGEIIEVQLSGEVVQVGGDACLLLSVANVSARREAERRAQQLSVRDPLTGLPNRVTARDRLQLAIDRATAAGRSIAVLHLDIDRFKSVNESMGYAAGDTLVRQVAGRLDANVVPGDTLARLAADEFLVVAESIRGAAEAQALADRLVAAMRKPFLLDGRELRVTLSTGIALGPDYATDADRLLRQADTAMHAAKSEGRGGWRMYDEALGDRLRNRMSIEAGLRQGIRRGEFRLHYQPKLTLASGELRGLEALLRWKHPELGEVSPSVFIPVAEESGVINELGAWVFGEACGQIARWGAQGLACVPVAVNLSAPQFTPALPRLLAESTREHGIAPELLELEVTESLLIKEPEMARRLLQQVTARGSRVLLDDFGVGYSSLSYVKLLDLHGIKIDRSFVRDLSGSRRDAAIVKAIVGLAHGLDLHVVGEGVETREQADLLLSLGCDEAQGFLFSPPVAADEIARRFLSPAPAAAEAT